MTTNCVEMTLYFTPINGGETQTETIYNYDYIKSGYLAWTFGCYYLQGDEIDYTDNSTWSLPYWPENIEQCKNKYQPLFQHDIDFDQYEYQISFFDAEHNPPETSQPPKPSVLVKPTLTLTLMWREKDNFKNRDKEKIILPNTRWWDFVERLGLFGGEIWVPFTYYDLDGWLSNPQIDYLRILYQAYGETIKHQYDIDKYYYSIELEPYEDL